MKEVAEFERANGKEHQANVKRAMAEAKVNGGDEAAAKTEAERIGFESWRKQQALKA